MRARPRKAANRRPRATVLLGMTKVNASDLRGLRYAWQHRELVLFLGAGVSIPYGLPSWNNLVLELLFENASGTRRLRSLWPHYLRAVASWMTDYFDYDPLVLARMIERDLRARNGTGKGQRRDSNRAFLSQLRKHIYANRRVPKERTVLDAIADLIKDSDAQKGIAAVVTFNFDDLLEQALRERNVKFESVTNAGRLRRSGTRVIHAHGFVPEKGPLDRKDLVFTEPDYHRLTESVFHWSLSEVVQHLRKSTVLFIGLSMSDPNLRRLLDASHNSDLPAHWQVQRRHEIRDQREEVMAEVERRARNYAALLKQGYDQRSKPSQLQASIDGALAQADTYDREVFESMGVKTIWVAGFEDIPSIIDAIR